MDVKTTADPWFYRYDPEEASAATDQVNPEAVFLKIFTSQLLPRESLPNGPRLFHDLLTTPLQELPHADNTFGSVLSAQNLLNDLPTRYDLTATKTAFFSKFHQRCPYLVEVPVETLDSQYENSSVAVASLGSCIACSTSHVSLCKKATRTMTTAAGMPNNRATRDPRSFIAPLPTLPNQWLLNETTAVMSSDAGLQREANFTHGFFETVCCPVKISFWAYLFSHVLGNPKVVEGSRSIPAYALLIDIVRALHFDVVPTTAWALRDIPIDKQGQYSMGSLQVVTFGQSSSDSTSAPQNKPVLALLLILTQIIIWAVIITPVEHWRQKPAARHQKMTTLTTEEECDRTRRKIEQALRNWLEAYLVTSSHEVKALYYFAQLHLLMPDLQSLVTQAGYKPRCLHENSGSKAVESIAQIHHGSINAVQTLHFAWLQLHSVAATQDRTFFWLPITTFMTGLCVWRCLKQQSASNGLDGVLRIVISELEKMPWPCCKTTIECLENLL